MNSSKRIQTLFSYAETPVDTIIIKNGTEPFIDPNFFYTTGITQGLFEGSSLVLYPDGTQHMLVNSLEHDIAASSSAIIHVYRSKREIQTILSDLLKDTSTIGIHYSALLYTDYLWLNSINKGKKLIDVTKSFHQSRMIKDKEEISAIKKACEIADKVAEEIPSYIQKGMTENELAAEIDYHLQRYGAHNPAFETIASFGTHSAIPHHTHDDTPLKKGDFIVCDFGAKYNKYHSDTTRTFVYGTATDKQKDIHETVRKAQHTAFDMIKPGIIANNIHHSVQTFIDSTVYKNRFIHSTGHSLGLSVHDPGIGFNYACTLPLKEHMILTVEPGIYIPGYGGVRIEDDIIITNNGYTSLTTSSRNLCEI